MIFRRCLVSLHGSGKMRDKAGIISNEPEGVGVGEKVPKNACTSGVFFGYFRRLPFWGGVDEVPVKFTGRRVMSERSDQ